MNAKEYYLQKTLKFADHKDRIFDRPELPAEVKKIHISGVCGKAMAPLAGLLTKKGYIVTGSDKECFPPMSDVLDELGIKTLPFDEENVKNSDVLVVGNVCTPSSVEPKFARENNLPQLSIAEALQSFIMKDRIRLVVAGTHGKTTTTGLLVHIFEIASKDPGFSIGGTMQEKEETYALGNGEHFIIEGDEYNTCYFDKGPKFLSYKAHGAIVTSVEYDHVDIYDDLADYKKAFEFFVEEIPEGGHLMIWGDDENVLELKEKTKANVHTYGFGESNEYQITDLEQGHGEQIFNLKKDGEIVGRLRTSLSGEYNLTNIAGAVGLALCYGLDFDDIAKAVASFKGMIKRQEVIYEDENVTIIDDYAHHPTSVDITLNGLKKHYEGRRMIVLFEPRSNTCRRKTFENDFTESLKVADVVLLKQPPFQSSDKEDDFISTENIFNGLTADGKEAYNFETTEEMVGKASELIKEKDLVVIMTNTSFDDAQGRLIGEIKRD